MIEVRKPTKAEMAEAAKWPIWQKGKSSFDWQYDEDETCHIIEGSAEVTAEDGSKAAFSKGDWVVFRAPLKCTWKITQDIRKHYRFG